MNFHTTEMRRDETNEKKYKHIFGLITQYYFIFRTPIYLLFHPIIIIPNRMFQQLLNQTSSPQSTCQWQMSLRCLFYIVYEFRSAKPTFLPLHFTVFGCPSNFCTECLKIFFALSIFFLCPSYIECQER